MHRTRKITRRIGKTCRKGRGSATRGWKTEQPSHHERSIMFEKCGKKCFLGPNKSFPICKKNTCDISSKGIYAAYIRSRQYRKRSRKYRNISQKTKFILDKLNEKPCFQRI